MTNKVIGIDIGGTNTVIGLIDNKGVCLKKSEFRTDSFNNGEIYVQKIIDIIKSDFLNNNEIKSIGIGAPNGNYLTGCIDEAPNLKWNGNLNIKKLIETSLNLNVVLTNDANAAAYGEMIFGAAKGMKNFAVITLGTGLGSGIVVEGKLLYGHTGLAGELGHVIVKPDDRKCGCGRSGCLETYASATGIKKTVIELLKNLDFESELRNYSINEISSKKIYEAALNNDEIALMAFNYTGRILGLSLANFANITSPEAIFLFGGLAQAEKYIFEPTIKSFNENILHILKDTVKILPSGLPNNMAAILGAAALCYE